MALYRQEAVDFQTVNADVASASVWDGKWHAIAGTYDGTVARLYVDGAQVASANAPFGYQVRHLGAGGPFSIGRCAVSGGYDPNLQFTGAIDDVRVYYRALTGAEIVALQPPEGSTQPPVEPGPDPNPDPGTTPGSSEPAPRITDVTTASLGAGRPFVLTAKIIGSFTQLLWDIRGDSGPEIVAAVGQDAIRLRGVRPSGAFTVRAIGPGGGSQLFAGKLPAVQTLGGTFAQDDHETPCQARPGRRGRAGGRAREARRGKASPHLHRADDHAVGPPRGHGLPDANLFARGRA